MRSLTFYIARRLLAFAGLLVLLSFLVFSLLYISPASPADVLFGPNPPTTAAEQESHRLLSEQYHLNEPFLTQYWIWARDAVQFKFGDSIRTTLPVSDEIKNRLAVTLFLGIYAFILTQ